MARVRVDVSAAEPVLRWPDVHGPARAVLYGLIGAREPDLARQLHDEGWQGSTLRPAGISPPLFTGAVQRRGVYATSGTGSIWLGSPVARIAAAVLRGLAGMSELRWGGTHLAIRGTEMELPPIINRDKLDPFHPRDSCRRSGAGDRGNNRPRRDNIGTGGRGQHVAGGRTRDRERRDYPRER